MHIPLKWSGVKADTEAENLRSRSPQTFPAGDPFGRSEVKRECPAHEAPRVGAARPCVVQALFTLWKR